MNHRLLEVKQLWPRQMSFTVYKIPQPFNPGALALCLIYEFAASKA